MSNPFIEPGSLITELEKRRRERFQIGVYAALGTASIFLAGMLIQGCQSHEQPPAGESGQTSSELVTNQPAATNSASTNPTADATNGVAVAAPSPDTNAPATPAEASANPAPTPVATTDAPAAPSSKPVSDAARPTNSKGSEFVYIVKRGDTLAHIAHAHGITVKALKSANKLKSDTIFAGKKLKIPQAAARPLPAASHNPAS